MPLYSPPEGGFLARLACLKHAASVRSEPVSYPSRGCYSENLVRARKRSRTGLTLALTSARSYNIEPQASGDLLCHLRLRSVKERTIHSTSIIPLPGLRVKRARHGARGSGGIPGPPLVHLRGPTGVRSAPDNGMRRRESLHGVSKRILYPIRPPLSSPPRAENAAPCPRAPPAARCVWGDAGIR